MGMAMHARPRMRNHVEICILMILGATINVPLARGQLADPDEMATRFEWAMAPATVTVALPHQDSGIWGSASTRLDGYCHPEVVGEYILQPALHNGKPWYAHSNGGTPTLWWNVQHLGLYTGWGFGANPPPDETEFGGDGGLMIEATDGALPTGLTAWTGHRPCAGLSATTRDWYSVPLSLTLSAPTAGCASTLAQIAPMLTSVCCGFEDGASCGVGGELPNTCSPDCRGKWAPFASLCSREAESLDSGSDAGRFFRSACAADSLHPLPETVVRLAPGDEQAFKFAAEAGTRYMLALRPGFGVRSSHLRVLPQRVATGITATEEPDWSNPLATDGVDFTKTLLWTAPGTHRYLLLPRFVRFFFYYYCHLGTAATSCASSASLLPLHFFSRRRSAGRS